MSQQSRLHLFRFSLDTLLLLPFLVALVFVAMMDAFHGFMICTAAYGATVAVILRRRIGFERIGICESAVLAGTAVGIVAGPPLLALSLHSTFGFLLGPTTVRATVWEVGTMLLGGAWLASAAATAGGVCFGIGVHCLHRQFAEPHAGCAQKTESAVQERAWPPSRNRSVVTLLAVCLLLMPPAWSSYLGYQRHVERTALDEVFGNSNVPRTMPAAPKWLIEYSAAYGLAKKEFWLKQVSLTIHKELSEADWQKLRKLRRIRFLALCYHGVVAAGSPPQSTPRSGIADFDVEKLVRNLNSMPAEVVWLDFSLSDITGLQLAALCKLKHLEVLDLSQTAVSDQAMEYVGQCATLRVLRLRNTQIGNIGLASLRNLPRLERLDLGQTQVTAEGLKHVESHVWLKWLALDGTSLSEDDITAMTAPGCYILAPVFRENQESER